MLCVASRARRGEKTRVPVVSRRGGGRVGREEADCAFQRLASIPDRRSRRSSPVGRRKTLNQRFLGWAVVFSLSLSLLLVPRFRRSIWPSKIERLPIRHFFLFPKK